MYWRESSNIVVSTLADTILYDTSVPWCFRSLAYNKLTRLPNGGDFADLTVVDAGEPLQGTMDFSNNRLVILDTNTFQNLVVAETLYVHNHVIEHAPPGHLLGRLVIYNKAVYIVTFYQTCLLLFIQVYRINKNRAFNTQRKFGNDYFIWYVALTNKHNTMQI